MPAMSVICADKTGTLTNDEKTQVYIWDEQAVTFMCDHPYGEMNTLMVEKMKENKDFKGYMYVDGDFLYVGKLCLCRSERLEGFDDGSLVGEWVGAAGDKLSFDSDGGYYYKDSGYEYNGTYELNEEDSELTLILGGEGTVLEGPQWGVNGRVLNIQDQYYFRASAE